MQTVYKAYVAARYLVNQHPGLAERIRALPRKADWPEQPPLRVIPPIVIFVCYEGDQLVPLDDAGKRWWSIGGTGFGGVSLDAGRKIAPPALGKQTLSNTWVGSALLDPNSQLEFVEHGDQAAVAFEIGAEPMPPEPMLRAAALVSALLLGVALLGAALRRWDWQQMEVTRTCGECGKIHGWTGMIALLGSVLSASGFFYLLGLPLLVAWQSGGARWLPLVYSVLLLAGVAAALMLLGTLVLAGLRRMRPAIPGQGGLLQAFFLGVQLSGIVMLAALWQGGVAAGTVGATCQRLLGPALGERLLVQLASPAPLAWAAWTLAAGLLVVLFSRWVVPLMLGSRPLLFSSSQSHHHSS